jgi:N-carbamoylputrescine amidase
MSVTLAAASANFGRDLEKNYATIERLLAEARAGDADLLALPEATLGGYLSSLGGVGDPRKPKSLPPALRLDGPELARVIAMAGETIIVLGICEAVESGTEIVRYNTAIALDGTGILGLHRKVHQPLGENMSYDPGSEFAAFETPIGRIGLLICQDKAFPEAARSLALDDAELIVCISAWPGSRTGSTTDLQEDRWTKRFTIFDQARALENQILWVASNQSGTFGSLRYVGNAKIVSPGGEILATTGVGEGLAIATVDVEESLATARRAMFYLGDRRPELYRVEATAHA